MTRHVILGAGPAGLNAIETIRALDANAAITLVCDEPAYARMVLPYRLGGTIQDGTLFTADDAWFERTGVEARIGRRAVGVDPAARTVSLDDGTQAAYDRLLVATGSRAARPPVPGADSARVHDLWTLADTDAVCDQDPRDVVVVGAGFIGLVILDALVQRGCRVRYLELERAILPRMLGADAAAIVAGHLAAHGVETLTGDALQRIEETPDGLRLDLASGERLTCDAVVLATGIRANVDFLAAAGVETKAGIVVDDHLRTTADDVFAAGDVAEGPDLLGDANAVHAIQPTAVDHGRVAGANMVGEEVAFSGSLVMNVLHTQGLQSCSFGRWSEAGGDDTVLSSPDDGVYRHYVFEGDRLVGGSLVGSASIVSGANDAGMLKGLIQSGVSLGPWKSYLKDHPLDLRRVFVATGAAKALLEMNLLTGRASRGGGYRFPPLPPKRPRSSHHEVLVPR